MSTFTGIPADALDFYDELGAANTRAWWQANKERYTASVREPLEGLLDALEDEFGPAHLYRPNRDVRFSKDKSPYKDHQGALATTVPGMGFYVHVNGDGLMTGGGFYPTGPDQLPRLRAAIDAPRSGHDLRASSTASPRPGSSWVATGSPPVPAACRPTTRAWN